MNIQSNRTHPHYERIERFVADLPTARRHVGKEGGFITVVADGKKYYAVPFGSVDHLDNGRQSLDVVKLRNNGLGRRGQQQIVLHPASLGKALERLSDNTTTTICFEGRDAISFITESAWNDLQKILEVRAAQTARPHAEGFSDANTAARANGTDQDAPADAATSSAQPAVPGLPSAIETEEKQGESNPMSEKTYLITERLSPWDHTKAHHGEKPFTNSLTIHRDRVVGLLIDASEAGNRGITDDGLLSDDETRWSATFRDTYAGLNILKNVGGLVQYKENTLFYATVGYMMARPEIFEPLIKPDLWSEIKEAHDNAVRLLPLQYLTSNALPLNDFGRRRNSYVEAVNGNEDRYNQGDVLTRSPILLRDMTVPKGIVLPGAIDLGPSVNVTEVSLQEYGPAWAKVRNGFPPNHAIRLKGKDNVVTIVSPDLSNPAVFEAVSKFCPSTEEMLAALNGNGNGKRPKKAPARPGSAPANTLTGADTLAGGADTLTIAEETGADTVDAGLAGGANNAETPPAGAVEPPLVAANPLPATASEATAVEETKNPLQSMLAQMQIVADAIKGLREASSTIAERQLGETQLLAYGANVASKLPENSLDALASIYNALRNADEEPEAKIKKVAYTGGAIDKAKTLSAAFADANRGDVVVIEDQGTMLVMTNNKAFAGFVKNFDIA